MKNFILEARNGNGDVVAEGVFEFRSLRDAKAQAKSWVVDLPEVIDLPVQGAATVIVRDDDLQEVARIDRAREAA